MLRIALIICSALTVVICDFDHSSCLAQVNLGSEPRENSTVPEYNRPPKFNTPPRYNSIPPYATVRDYNSVPTYSYVPEYNLLRRYNPVPVYATVPRYFEIPVYNGAPAFNRMPINNHSSFSGLSGGKVVESRIVAEVPTQSFPSNAGTKNRTMGFRSAASGSKTTTLRKLDIGRIAQGQEIERSWVIRRPDAFKITSVNNSNPKLRFSYSGELTTFHIVKYYLDTEQSGIIEDTIVVNTNLPGVTLKRRFKAQIVAARSNPSNDTPKVRDR